MSRVAARPPHARPRSDYEQMYQGHLVRKTKLLNNLRSLHIGNRTLKASVLWWGNPRSLNWQPRPVQLQWAFPADMDLHQSYHTPQWPVIHAARDWKMYRTRHSKKKKVLQSTFFWCFRLSQLEDSIQYLEGPNSTWKENDRNIFCPSGPPNSYHGSSRYYLVLLDAGMSPLYLWQAKALRKGAWKYLYS